MEKRCKPQMDGWSKYLLMCLVAALATPVVVFKLSPASWFSAVPLVHDELRAQVLGLAVLTLGVSQLVVGYLLTRAFPINRPFWEYQSIGEGFALVVVVGLLCALTWVLYRGMGGGKSYAVVLTALAMACLWWMFSAGLPLFLSDPWYVTPLHILRHTAVWTVFPFALLEPLVLLMWMGLLVVSLLTRPVILTVEDPPGSTYHGF